MMDINFYVKSMWSFIILSVMWYKRLTNCYLLHTDSLEFRELEKICQQHAFLYQLWTTGALLNIYFLALQTTTPKIPPMRLMSLDHEQKMRCCAMSTNYGPRWDYIAKSFEPWALASFLWIWTLLDFKIDSPKIQDSVDVVRVANEMKPCNVKNLSSTIIVYYQIKIPIDF